MMSSINTNISTDIISECRRKLLTMKGDLLNRLMANRFYLSESHNNFSGDEIDQTVAQLEENSLLINQSRIRQQLLDIEMALAKIEDGTFGICEETDEVIEPDRLLAIPWTRLSIEGAEIRESLLKRVNASKKC